VTGERTIDAVVAGMQERIDALPAMEHRRFFMQTYLRTTLAVQKRILGAGFEDPAWIEHWDVAFAGLFIDAHDADLAGDTARVSRPWRLAFYVPVDQPPLRSLLLGMNAHVNYDLPQSLLAVITDEQFRDGALMDQRRRDHERIDAVLASQVSAEDAAISGSQRTALLDRVLTPLNRAGTKRFLREARTKVWHNTLELQRARLAGPDDYRARLAELEVLSAAKIADLLAPGQVILRLSVAGFGVVLPPPS
jgi:Family of unknown function (DUF5995)